MNTIVTHEPREYSLWDSVEFCRITNTTCVMNDSLLLLGNFCCFGLDKIPTDVWIMIIWKLLLVYIPVCMVKIPIFITNISI